MDRRKALKITLSAFTAIAGIGVAGYFTLDRIFNPKTPVNYGFPEEFAKSSLLKPTPQCTGRTETTLFQTEGPFYTPDTPQRNNFLEAGMKGTKLIVDGFVVDTHCKPITGTVLDFWSCDSEGIYDNEGMRLRGHQFTDENGHYRLETIRPKYYSAGPFGSRTAHIHVKVQGSNTQLLTTQLYFPDEPMNQQDAIFDDSLVVKMLSQQRDTQHAEFNFVLA